MPNPIRSIRNSLSQIPTRYRFWASFGILIALLIALPITLMGFMTGTFELRKRAATSEPTLSPPVVIFGNAALFDNPYEIYKGYLQTQYIKTEENSSLNARQQMTIEAWIQLMDREPIEDQVIIAKKAGGNQFVIGSYWLGVSSDLRLKFSSPYIRVPISPNVISESLESNEVLKTGCWYHVAISVDNPRVRMFINGHLDREGDFGQFPSEDVKSKVSIAANLSDLKSGQIDVPAYLFNGEIDEVRLSSIARYTSSFSPPLSPYLVDGYTTALWHLDYKMDNNMVPDDSPSANWGTVIGNVAFIPSGASVLCPITVSPPAVSPTPIPCGQEGETIPVYPGYQCCPGLEPISTAHPDVNGNCPGYPPLGASTCVKDCGDGQCTLGENKCNCPEDCGLVPTPTPTGGPLHLKIKFGGVTSRPIDDSDREIKIYATNLTGGPDLGSANNKESVIMSVDDSGAYSGEIILDASYFFHRYRLRIKGPKHLQGVFPDVFFLQELDLTDWPLRPGDVDQDGKVDINDLRAIKVFSTNPADIAFGDVNFDNRLSILDRVLILSTLSVQYDPD